MLKTEQLHHLHPSEQAESATGGEHHEGIESASQVKCHHRQRDACGLPSAIGGTRHNSAAGNYKSYGYRNEPDANGTLQSRCPHPVPCAVSAEIHGAGRSESRECARQCPWDPPHLPADKAHHQDHVRPRDAQPLRRLQSVKLARHSRPQPLSRGRGLHDSGHVVVGAIRQRLWRGQFPGRDALSPSRL